MAQHQADSCGSRWLPMGSWEPRPLTQHLGAPETTSSSAAPNGILGTRCPASYYKPRPWLTLVPAYSVALGSSHSSEQLPRKHFWWLITYQCPVNFLPCQSQQPQVDPMDPDSLKAPRNPGIHVTPLSTGNNGPKCCPWHKVPGGLL